MTDPRLPETRRKEAQLPDALDQVPAEHQDRGASGAHGSEDAQLLDAGEGQGDIERGTPSAAND
jgi:hypothetical protein